MGQTALSESLRGVEAEIAARQPERALMLAQDVQTRFPRALAAQRVIGEVYLALRKTREAIGALDRALAGDPEDARACCARAIVQQIQGDSMGALAWYRRACDMRPGDKVLRSAYRELARSLYQPAYEPSRIGLARLYLRGSLFPHAIHEWEAILAERPDALEAHVGLAETLWRAGNTPAAADRCRRLLLNAPSCVKAQLILAAIEHDAGQDDEARNQLRRAAELDPDMRIARELFADRLAANDRALSLLIFGEEPPASRSRSVPLAQPVGAPGVPAEIRPSVPSQPAARIGTGALAQSQPVTGPVTGTLPPATYATNAPASRQNGLPPDFHRIFSETKDMLWHDDMEGQETQGRIPNAPAFDRSRAEPFARSQAVMPPALAGATGPLEDTEARLSINFLNWLQAQGAVAQNAALPGPGAPGTTGPVPVPMPPRPRPSSQPLDDSRYPQGPDMGTGPLPTGPLPLPTPEALKAMFAELEPETATRRIVDADVVSASDVGDWNAERDNLAAAVPADLAEQPSAGAMGGWGDDARVDRTDSPAAFTSETSTETDPFAGATGPLMPPAPESEASSWMPGDGQSGGATSAIPAESATADEETPHYSAFSGFAPAQDDIPAESATDSGEAPTTLEALEQGFARSGFESYDMRPGELAAMAAQMPATAFGEQPPDFAESGSTDMLAPSPEQESRPAGQSASQPAGPAPAPDDYAGRLDFARERRAAGNLDDALGEYRIILKNAPDLLGDVMDDLNESLDAAPDHPEIHRLLGDAHIRQGDYLSALEAYNRAVALTQAQGN